MRCSAARESSAWLAPGAHPPQAGGRVRSASTEDRTRRRRPPAVVRPLDGRRDSPIRSHMLPPRCVAPSPRSCSCSRRRLRVPSRGAARRRRPRLSRASRWRSVSWSTTSGLPASSTPTTTRIPSIWSGRRRSRERHTWGVFLTIENPTEDPLLSADAYTVHDTLDTAYETVDLESPYALEIGTECRGGRAAAAELDGRHRPQSGRPADLPRR